ncbi:hypothetical protein I350_06063 [Cryptococcus amylolentus CBS 6273]|uniref:Uncharacterized protein n=1 Tax=Cryptococcus amylolentus CBS 6273 TaxID=1296118 RepID=A0A1E3JQR7_9TREE|nr:hypothetical protein I350_06063 [Cryptococcus amylolentus CBS 6273]
MSGYFRSRLAPSLLHDSYRPFARGHSIATGYGTRLGGYAPTYLNSGSYLGRGAAVIDGAYSRYGTGYGSYGVYGCGGLDGFAGRELIAPTEVINTTVRAIAAPTIVERTREIPVPVVERHIENVHHHHHHDRVVERIVREPVHVPITERVSESHSHVNHHHGSTYPGVHTFPGHSHVYGHAHGFQGGLNSTSWAGWSDRFRSLGSDFALPHLDRFPELFHTSHFRDTLLEYNNRYNLLPPASIDRVLSLSPASLGEYIVSHGHEFGSFTDGGELILRGHPERPEYTLALLAYYGASRRLGQLSFPVRFAYGDSHVWSKLPTKFQSWVPTQFRPYPQPQYAYPVHDNHR